MNKTIWQEKIKAINKAGMTYEQIGTEVGCATSTIGDLAIGRSKSPNGMTAVNLAALYEKVERQRRRRQ